MPIYKYEIRNHRATCGLIGTIIQHLQTKRRLKEKLWYNLNKIEFESNADTDTETIFHFENRFSFKLEKHLPICSTNNKIFYSCFSFAFYTQTAGVKSNNSLLYLQTPDEIINQFADIHELLGGAMENVSA